MMRQSVAATGELPNEGGEVLGGQEAQVTEILARVEQNLNDLAQGLSLLGVKRCSQCKNFFRSSDRGALFGSDGELVCFGCVPAWWAARREQLSCEDVQKTESDLVFWLRSFHNARLMKHSNKPDEDQPVRFELVASCLECRGSGTLLGDRRCRYCDGPGTVRVIVPEKGR
jgi:hypothetical protein